MGIEIVTREDLAKFKVELLDEIRSIVLENSGRIVESVEGYKTSHVRKILGCSFNKLVSLRVSRNIRTKKVGGTLYYNKEDVKRLVEEGF